MLIYYGVGYNLTGTSGKASGRGFFATMGDAHAMDLTNRKSCTLVKLDRSHDVILHDERQIGTFGDRDLIHGPFDVRNCKLSKQL